MKEAFLKTLKYLLLGILTVPLSIFTHELGHYFAYLAFGAGNVQLHSVSVSADKENLTHLQIAFASFLGPIITYITIALCFFVTRKEYKIFWMFLALAAPIGRIVNFIYVALRLAGNTPNPNFDEFNFSKSIGIDPLILSVFTVIIVCVTFFIFLRRAYAEDGLAEIGRLAFGIAAGLAVWATVGGLLLP